MPVIYQNFTHSEDLLIQNIIDEFQFLNYKKILKKFKIIKIKDESEINSSIKEDVLYDIRIEFFDSHFNKVENIKIIKERFKNLIKPKYELKMPCILNKDDINIAIHARKGGGYDLPLLSKDGFDKVVNDKNFKPIDANKLSEKFKNKKFFYADQRWPLKFPPDSFYIEQIKKIINIYPNKKFHIHVFTDDQNSKSLLEKYKKVIANQNVTFTCREEDNHHTKNIIDDFFAMAKFDCLVRPISSYSQNAEFIGNFKIIIWPEHGTWNQKDHLVIDKVHLSID